LVKDIKINFNYCARNWHLTLRKHLDKLEETINDDSFDVIKIEMKFCLGIDFYISSQSLITTIIFLL